MAERIRPGQMENHHTSPAMCGGIFARTGHKLVCMCICVVESSPSSRTLFSSANFPSAFCILGMLNFVIDLVAVYERECGSNCRHVVHIDLRGGLSPTKLNQVAWYTFSFINAHFRMQTMRSHNLFGEFIRG